MYGNVPHMEDQALTVRISAPLLKRLRDATRELYAPSQAEIVRRGIVLALTEYEKRRDRREKR